MKRFLPFLLIFLTGIAHAATLTANADNLVSVVNGATNGDTIVATGTHNIGVGSVITGKSVTIDATGATLRIDATGTVNDTDPVLDFRNCAAITIQLGTVIDVTPTYPGKLYWLIGARSMNADGWAQADLTSITITGGSFTNRRSGGVATRGYLANTISGLTDRNSLSPTYGFLAVINHGTVNIMNVDGVDRGGGSQRPWIECSPGNPFQGQLSVQNGRAWETRKNGASTDTPYVADAGAGATLQVPFQLRQELNGSSNYNPSSLLSGLLHTSLSGVTVDSVDFTNKTITLAKAGNFANETFKFYYHDEGRRGGAVTVDGARLVGGQAGVFIHGVKTVAIRNVRGSMLRDYVAGAEWCTDVLIEKCYATNPLAGVTFGLYHHITTGTIQDCTSMDGFIAIVPNGGPMTNITIQRNNIYNVTSALRKSNGGPADGIRVLSSASTASHWLDGLTIANNNLHDCGMNLANVFGTQEAETKNITLNGTNRFLFFRPGAKAAYVIWVWGLSTYTVTGNAVTGTNVPGIFTKESSGGSFGTSSNGSVSSNSLPVGMTEGDGISGVGGGP